MSVDRAKDYFDGPVDWNELGPIKKSKPVKKGPQPLRKVENNLDKHCGKHRIKKFWVVLGAGSGLESKNTFSNSNFADQVIDDEEVVLSHLKSADRVDRFFDKQEAVDFAQALSLKNPGDEYFVLESIVHSVIAPAKVIISDISMIIGNGYTKNHDQIALDILRESNILRKIFEEKYVKK